MDLTVLPAFVCPPVSTVCVSHCTVTGNVLRSNVLGLRKEGEVQG